MITRYYLITLLVFFSLIPSSNGQKIGFVDDRNGDWLFELVQPAPESVFKKFRDAGMEPVNHLLTDSEKEILEKCFSILPSSYQHVLKQHLHSVSFMDNMPNTALTSTLDPMTSARKFNITFRAGLFSETVSQWATWKENTCYVQSDSNDYQVIIEAGEMNAMVYVLLHEATHVVDAVIGISPQTLELDSVVSYTPLTQDIWHERNVPVEAYINPLLETTRFRSGKPIPISQASEVYNALEDTPFVSLYSMASWFEDLAELMTVYYLTTKLNQPFQISVRKDGKAVFSYVPMENELVKLRVHNLESFLD